MGLPAYFSLMPDNVPLHQRGMASGSSPNCFHNLCYPRMLTDLVCVCACLRVPHCQAGPCCFTRWAASRAECRWAFC